MAPIYPVMLAGGLGTRLWPLSRKSYPKQFSKLLGDLTLFQQSAMRSTSSKKMKFKEHITLTNSDFRFIVSEQLQEIGIEPGPILIEPEAKNTAPAILAACLFAKKVDPNAILLVTPSDHLIPNTSKFHEMLNRGLDQVYSNKIVTFGIKPTHPETGYGYLELEFSSINKSNPSDILSFVEKPTISRAKTMFAAGNYLWNAGIFLFKAIDLIKAFKNFEPDMFEFTAEAFNTAKSDLGFLRLNPEPWKKLKEKSIDYAIMEKADNLIAVPFPSKWSDLGGWDSVLRESKKDRAGNAFSTNAHAIDCSNTLLRSESPGQQVVGLGLKNLIAIAMKDAVLIADKDKAQNVKQVTEYLKSHDIPQAEIFPKDYRPWGWFESLVMNQKFQVKRIFVNPGASLSLQSHKYRSEHWIVVQGTAKVTIEDEIKHIKEGQSIYVPLGAIHRMENPGQEPMTLIEVQIGSYFGEDDITRYEDAYSRI